MWVVRACQHRSGSGSGSRKRSGKEHQQQAAAEKLEQDPEQDPEQVHSCTFTGVELNYNVHDKELMAIFEAFKHWRLETLP